MHLLTKKYLKYQNTKYSVCSILNTKYKKYFKYKYFKYKYFKYCPPLRRKNASFCHPMHIVIRTAVG